jgi:integrase
VNIRKRGRSYQIRVAGFPAQTAPTREAAERIALDLKRRRSLGELYEAPAITLGEAIDGLLAWIEATRSLSEKTREFNRRSAMIWTPLREVRLSRLRRAQVKALILPRAQAHTRSARNELELLKRVLRYAKGEGQRIDEAILYMDAVRHRPRRGRALTMEELCELASWFPEHVSRMVLLAGQIGFRQNVWFELTDEMLDLRAETITIPAWLAKSRREHCIYPNAVEMKFLREQLVVRVAGTNLVFPTVEGKKWAANRFRDRVWLKSIEAAAANNPGSPFKGFTFHMLRHTAASLMAIAGMRPSAVAERLEHSDGGALFHKTYRHLYEDEKRNEARRLEPMVLAALDKNGTSDGEEDPERVNQADGENGRYWARTSDPQLVELVLSQLS